MTINIADNNPRVSYSVSAGVTQTSFAVPFEFFDETDVLVYIGSTLKTLNTDYTVSGGDGTTGTITMSVTGPATVALVRDITIERSTDFPTAGPFSVQSLNVELDKQIAIDADISDQIDRAVRSPIEEFTTMTLPDAATRADKLLKFDTAGNVAVESASALVGGAVVGANFTNNTFTGDGSQTAFTTTVQAGSKNNAQVYIDGVYQLKSSFSVSGLTLTFTEAPPLNSQIEVIIGNAIDNLDGDSGNVNYNQGGTGAQTRTVENKLQEFVSVKDFGAVCDGVTDDFNAVQKALWYLWDQGGGTLLVNGPCGISKRLNFDTHDFMCSNPLGGGGDGKDAGSGVYSDANVPMISIVGHSRPQALNNGNVENSETAGFYWVGTSQDDMLKITGDADASWRGCLVFKNLIFNGGDNASLNSATAALDGIWVASRCNRGNLFEDIVITKCSSTGFRYGTDDTSSNNIFSNTHNRVFCIYNGQNGFIIKGNQHTFSDCSAERNALDGIVWRKMNNNNRWTGGAVQFNARHQILIEGPSQLITMKDLYFEGVNQNTVDAITASGNSFIKADDTDGDIVSVAIEDCRFVYGGDATVEEDYLFDLDGNIYSFAFVRNSINCANITIINKTSGTFSGSSYAGNQFSGGLGIVEYDSTTTRDEFVLWLDKAGLFLNEGSPLAKTSSGSFTMTGTGFSASTTVTAYYQIIGDIVHVSMPDLSGTSNATTFTITGFPVVIRPDSDRQFAGRWATDNGSNIDTARGILDASGVMTMYTTAGTASNNSWTSSGIKRLRNGEFSYKLNR